MRWTWEVACEDPDLADEMALGWESREAAEAWLKDCFAELVEYGAERATLMDGDTAVYTMSLLED